MVIYTRSDLGFLPSFGLLLCRLFDIVSDAILLILQIHEDLRFQITNPRSSEPFSVLKHSRCGPFYRRSEFVFTLTISGTQNRDLEGGEKKVFRFFFWRGRMPKFFSNTWENFGQVKEKLTSRQSRVHISYIQTQGWVYENA